MTRIIGGTWGGRRLVTPTGETTRPTAEKVRAALASSLYATGGLDGARVLDLYAGSGALGLELVSRGASSAVFVERDRAALAALRANIAALEPSLPAASLPPGSVSRASLSPPSPRASVSPPSSPASAQLTVIPGDVAAFASRSAGVGPFDVVVADPPYDLTSDALADVLTGLQLAGLLAAHADLVIERGRKSGPPEWPAPLAGVRTKKYGDTLLCYGRAP